MITILTIGGCVVAIGLGMFFHNVIVGVVAGVIFGVFIQGYSHYRQTVARQEAEARAKEEEQRARREERRRRKEKIQATRAAGMNNASYKKKAKVSEADVTILREASPDGSVKPEAAPQTLAEK